MGHSTRDLQRHTAGRWTRAVTWVLLLLVVIIAITPVTQAVWSADSFLYGHNDTESTLVFGLGFFGLTLLMARLALRSIYVWLYRWGALRCLERRALRVHGQGPGLNRGEHCGEADLQGGFTMPLLV